MMEQSVTPKQLTASVIIPTYYRDSNLHAALLLLFSQTYKPKEIIVVDQTPDCEHDDSTKNFLEKAVREEKIKWLHLQINSLTMARNFGIRNANGDILIFIDDDVLIGEDFVEAHVACYQNSKCMIVTGQSRLGSERGMPRVPTAVDLSPVGFLSSTNSYIGTLTPFNRISGGNFSGRREVFMRLKGFDEQLTGAGFGEDVDFALRCIAEGIPITYSSTAWIYHLASPRGGGRAERNRPKQQWLPSRLYLAFRHMRGRQFYWFVFGFIGRRFLLNKTTAIRPWQIPAKIAIFVAALFEARVKAKQTFKGLSENKEYL